MKFLNKEYTKYDSENKPWKNGLFSASVVFFMFLLFQPFGFRDKDLALKLILFPLYALIAYLYSISNFFFVRQIIKLKKKWFLKNELQSLFVSVMAVTFIVHLVSVRYTGDMPLSINWFFKLLYHVSSLFLIIAVVEILYYRNKSSIVKIEHLYSQVQQVSQQLTNVKKETGIEILTITLEKESIEINRNKLICIKSVGNYLEFYLRENGDEIKKLVKRGRIHQVEKDLDIFPEFLRCHRAFIVNLKQAKKIKGSTKNAKLVFDQKLEEIPVSRSQFKILKERLDKIIAA